MREAHVPAEQPAPQEAPRVPVSHAYPGRSSRAQGSASPGPHAPVGLIQRVRDRASFAALARAPRHAQASLAVRCVADADGTSPRVAYAVGRTVGTAVARNRVRRRLRAAAAACESELRTGKAYLVSGGREVLRMPFEELVGTLGRLLASAGHSERAGA